MKKLRKTLVLSLLFILILGPSLVHADVGPKPSVNLIIDNLRPDQAIYVTLLAKEESTGPYSTESELPDYHLDWEEGFNKFKDLKDRDGYNFLGYVERLDGPGTFSWSYYPPRDFKIAIYDPELNLVLISQPMERYAFSSTYKFSYNHMDLADQVFYFDHEIEVKKDPGYGREIKAFVLRLALTILIEYLIAFLIFRPNAYQRSLIIKTNILTQALLNLGISILLYYKGFMAFFLIFIPMEILVFIIEAFIYKRRLNLNLPAGKKKAPAITYALVANLASALIGYYLVRYFTFFSNNL